MDKLRHLRGSHAQVVIFVSIILGIMIQTKQIKKTHMLKVFGKKDVSSVLTWPLVNQAVEEAMKATSQEHPKTADTKTSYVFQPPRTLVQAGDKSQILFTMPCYVGNYQLPVSNADTTTFTKHNTLACKLVTSFSGNDQRRPALPNIMANILLFSEQTGELLCLMDATQITAMRTAAASIVATKYLYFHRGGSTFQQRQIKVAIIGCGVQGRSHAFDMCHTFDVSEIYLWNRMEPMPRADKLAEDLCNTSHGKAKAVKVQVASTPAEAVADADVICVGTFADKALVEYAMLKKGDVHINTVGAGQVHFGEVSNDIYTKAIVYVDTMASAHKELKGLPVDITDEVGRVILKKTYPQEGSITIFQSLGMASEDATVAQAVFEALESIKKC